MTRHLSCKDAAVLTGCLLVISGCTGGAVQRAVHQDVAIGSGPVRLTSFHGCGGELAALRKAAEASVGPYGLPGRAASVNGTAYPAAAAGAPQAAAGAGAAAAAPAAVPAYSGTNDYVAGVDEPDLVKTDGRRIVTVAGGVLEVIDAASRTVTGRPGRDQHTAAPELPRAAPEHIYRGAGRGQPGRHQPRGPGRLAAPV